MSVEQLVGISRDTHDKVRMERRDVLVASLVREFGCALLRVVEIKSVLHGLGAERSHRGVLLDGVAVWNDDHDRHLEVPPRKGKALAVIASRCAYNPLDLGALALQTLDIGKPTSHLECADRRVVLVFDHNLNTKPLLQERPSILRRGWHDRTHHIGSALEIVQAEHECAYVDREQENERPKRSGSACLHFIAVNPARGRRSTGTATLELVVDVSGPRPVIVGET